jgi:UDP-glucose:tetrahydrobiopterin glucosyltransferase
VSYDEADRAIMRLLFVSTPVSPIGTGDGGGVETTLIQLGPALRARGHEVAVIAPERSRLPNGIALHTLPGEPPPSAATIARDASVLVQPDGVLERMWERARKLSTAYDAIVALSYDWLSYYLTPFLPVPVFHLVTLPSCIEAVDLAMRDQYLREPGQFAFCSRTQAASFSFVDVEQTRIIPGAVDTSEFQFHAEAEPMLVWAARISPEKGLEEALEAAQRAGLPLHVCGKIQNEEYWRRIAQSAPAGTLTYHGFLSHRELSAVVGRAAAMLITPKWIEAFGLTVIEALACGTPVIAYDQGGPAEIVEDGKSGFLVPAGDIGAMTVAVGRVGSLCRADARRRAKEFSIVRIADRLEEWVTAVLGGAQQRKLAHIAGEA